MKPSTISSKTSSKTALKTGKEIRLNRFLADAGLGSRRKVEELITTGLISVDGEICRDLATMVDPAKTKVLYQGKELSKEKDFHYLLLNKPRGYVVSRADEYSRKTIYELLPEFAAQLSYAGRLDKESEGLILLTNDGELIQKLTHPTQKIEKVYRVVIDKKLLRSQLEHSGRAVEIAAEKLSFRHLCKENSSRIHTQSGNN